MPDGSSWVIKSINRLPALNLICDLAVGASAATPGTGAISSNAPADVVLVSGACPQERNSDAGAETGNEVIEEGSFSQAFGVLADQTWKAECSTQAYSMTK